MLLVCGDEEVPDVMMVCVSVNTECHRTCLGDVLALELCQKNTWLISELHSPDIISTL